MTAPLVAISQRRDFTGPPHNETRDALDYRLAEFVLAAGGMPLPVPSALTGEALANWLARMRPDAVLLSGGSDIGMDKTRDALDLALLAHARDAGLPLLGICRGMQVMGHAAGVGLKTVSGHVAKRHQISGAISRSVNSYHAQTLADLPDAYRMLARAADGEIEAIGHETLPWEGWMWHPEREEKPDPQDISRFRKIIS